MTPHLACPARPTVLRFSKARLGLATECRDLMPDPPRRLILVHEGSRHEAALVATVDLRANPDARYGIPLLRARSAFVEPHLWQAALVASNVRSDVAWKNAVPGSPWRYERFLPLASVPREPWAAWSSQEADPFYRAEAGRQNAFYESSLALGRRLLAGELEGHGRLGNMIGPWTLIPAEAWGVLEVPYEGGFRNWGLGHVSGAGLEFWGVRITDKVGLTLQNAAIAYGPPEEAFVAQKAMALKHKEPEAVSNPGILSSRMKEASTEFLHVWESRSVGLGEAVTAIGILERFLMENLQSGHLIADGVVSGERRMITATEWAKGVPDLHTSTLVLDGLEIDEIRVRQAQLNELPQPEKSSFEKQESTAKRFRKNDALPRSPVTKELLAWYTDRYRKWPKDVHAPGKAKDWEDAQAYWAGRPSKPTRTAVHAVRTEVAPDWRTVIGRPAKAPKR